MEEMDVADVTLRLRFPFLYVLIGIHAFCMDKDLRRAAWGKCRTGFVIGAFVGLLWVCSERRFRVLIILNASFVRPYRRLRCRRNSSRSLSKCTCVFMSSSTWLIPKPDRLDSHARHPNRRSSLKFRLISQRVRRTDL